MLEKLQELVAATQTLFSKIKTSLDSKLDKTANAVSASKLKTPFTLNVSNDVTGSVSIDGSQNVSLALTLKDITGITAGAYGAATSIPVVTVDAKGRIVGISTIALGNAPTATKLATARKINGVNFDGTADITIADSTKEPTVAAGTAAQYWNGSKAWTDFAGSVRSSVLTGLSLAVSGAISATDSVLVAMARLQVQINNLTTGKLDVNGTAAYANQLFSARQLNFNGDVSGSQMFDGSAGITTTLSLATQGFTAGQYTKLTVSAKGIVIGVGTLDKTDIPNIDISQVTSLASSLAGKLDTTGTAAAASKWAAARTLSWTGDATGSMSVDGSGNASAALTLAASGVTAGTYAKVTVTAKGLVTAGAALAAADIPNLDTSKLTSGTLPVARGGTGGTDQASARSGLGIGSMATRNVFISTAAPASGDGSDGDIWLQYS